MITPQHLQASYWQACKPSIFMRNPNPANLKIATNAAETDLE